MIIALTGHRPNKIAKSGPVKEKVGQLLKENPPRAVINGLASGFDLWAANVAINLGIPVVSAKPWTTHGPVKGDEEVYQYVVNHSEEVYVVVEADEYPGPWVYQKRNEWMVDNATDVLGCWDGVKKGGTWNCLNYAKNQKRRTRHFHPDTLVLTQETWSHAGW